MTQDAHLERDITYRDTQLKVTVHSRQGGAFTALCNVVSGAVSGVVGVAPGNYQTALGAAHVALDYARDQIDRHLDGHHVRVATDPFLDQHFRAHGIAADARIAEYGPRAYDVFLWLEPPGGSARNYRSATRFESKRDAERAVLHGLVGYAEFDESALWVPMSIDQRLGDRIE